MNAAITRGQFASAAEHFARFGAAEGRDPNALFNTSYYLAQNNDVAQSVNAKAMTAWSHYITFGWKENRDPSVWFDTDAYLTANSDVARAGVNPLLHFTEFGVFENRLAPANDAGLWVV